MGTYNKFYLDADITDLATVAHIRESFSKDVNDFDFAWRKWSESTKWYMIWDLTKEVSKKFSNIIFKLKSEGEDGTDTVFYLNGNEVQEEFVWPKPKFPTRPQLKKGLKLQNKIYAERRAAYEESKRKQEEASKNVKIAKLEAELKKLKAG